MTKQKLTLLLGLVLCLLFIYSVSFAQPAREIYLQEDFTQITFPPTGWSISAQPGNWSRYAGATAGGVSPELRLNWSPQFNGSTYFISPEVDLTGNTAVILDFKHFSDHYATPYTLGAATRSNGGAWNTVWSVNPSGDIGPETRSITITNADVGSSTFQFALFFEGDSYNIDYWYIDDIKLYTPFDYDLAVIDTPGANHVDAGTAITPTCVVNNVGMNTLTATVSCDIYEWNQLMQSYPDYAAALLESGQEQSVTFPAFTPNTPEEMYRFVYTVTSLEDVIDGDLTNNTMDKWIDTYINPKQQVLLEIGTGTWCTFCPGAAMAADDFIDGEYNVAVIENHNGDPYANDYSNARNTYYGIGGYPTGVFDGMLRYVGGNHTTSVFPSYLPLFQQRENILTPLDISIYGEETGINVYDVEIHVDKYANMINQNLALQFALTESEIMVNWQDQDHLNFVNRLMVPDAEGTLIEMPNNELYVFPLPLIFNSAWDESHCELVAFIQDLDTKEVIQAQKVMLTALEAPPVSNDDNVTPALVNSLGAGYPNPFRQSASFSYTLKDDSSVKLEVYNVKGQLVKTMVSDNVKAGRYSATWDGKNNKGENVASGVYFFRMNTGSFSASRKMILMK